MASLGNTSPWCRSITKKAWEPQLLKPAAVNSATCGLCWFRLIKAFQAAIDHWVSWERREMLGHGWRWREKTGREQFDILWSVASCSSRLSQALHLGLRHSLSIKQLQMENSALSYDSHTWALSQASWHTSRQALHPGGTTLSRRASHIPVWKLEEIVLSGGSSGYVRSLGQRGLYSF